MSPVASIAVAFFTIFVAAANPTNRDYFVVDFLTLKHCKHAIIFDCFLKHNTTLDRAYVLRAANTRSISIRFIDITSDSRQHNVTTIFTPRQYAKLCAVLDYTCPGAPKLLDQVSQHRYMNSTISWMLLSRNTAGTALQRTLWNTAGIQMNSDLITGVETAVQGVFNVFDIYSKGRHLCKDIYQTLLGRWSNESGIRLMANYSTYKIRQNFNFLQLRGVTVIDRENVTSEQVDRLLSEPGLTKGIVAFVKYHYALLVVLRDFHNFTIKYRPTRGWAGRIRSGYRLGLLGVVQRHETDVAATGIIMRLSRQPELDSIHYSWAFETGFIYKITPDIGSKSEGNGFVAPFSPSVWVTFLVSLALAVVVLKYLAQLSDRWLRHRERTRATMGYVLDVMSCVAQQGVPHVSRLVPSRVAVIVLLVANLVLYNYYTSTVVSGLLSSKMIGPESIPQVIDSPLKLSLTDTGYHRILLRVIISVHKDHTQKIGRMDSTASTEQTLPYSTRMHERKALPPRSPDDLPLFTDVEHAVPYLRRGGHVLHCELTEVYPAIANQFTANEICELRTVEGLYKYDIRVMAFVLPKHSMYGELFKITLMRAQETGVVKRIYRIHKIAKPICQGSATVYSVELTEVSLAFIILGGCKRRQNAEHSDGSLAWIFLANEHKLQKHILEWKNVLCLRLDSDVLWIQRAKNDSLYHLLDMYAFTNTLCDSFHTATLGHWRRVSGLHIIDGFSKVNPISTMLCLSRLGFIFRLTPELNGATLECSYVSPFTRTTWCSAASIFALVLVVLQCMTLFHKELSSYAPNHYSIDMIGMVAQQGTTQTSAKLSVRIVLFAVLVMNFLLYNYYSASIVGDLLSSSNQGPKTIAQLIKAPLSIVYNNDSYNRALPQHDASSDRIYKDVPSAIRLLKRGGFAFHCELTEAYREIADQFDAQEICELRTMEGLYSELRLMSFVLPKKSMYTEQFKLTLTRATELGIIGRLLKMYNNEKPTCQGGALVHPVVLSGVSIPFMVLAVFTVKNAPDYIPSLYSKSGTIRLVVSRITIV
uniref:Ionotropic receptor 75a N-terminal domain-containing protein n=1 Tax=Anopheles minimus TaxID=112268 RepID=A0A182VU21_9DIPT